MVASSFGMNKSRQARGERVADESRVDFTESPLGRCVCEAFPLSASGTSTYSTSLGSLRVLELDLITFSVTLYMRITA